jgi:hypothetical protein
VVGSGANFLAFLAGVAAFLGCGFFTTTSWHVALGPRESDCLGRARSTGVWRRRESCGLGTPAVPNRSRVLRVYLILVAGLVLTTRVGRADLQPP